MAFVRSVAEADDEVGRSFKMIGDLLGRFFGDRGGAIVLRFLERGEHEMVPAVVKPLAHRRPAEIAIGRFDEQHVLEVAPVAQESQIVGRAACSLKLTGIAEPQFSLADQVERDVGERDILFERGGMAAPRGIALREDQRVVAHAQRKGERGFDRYSGFAGNTHHICPISSGMS